MDLTDKVIVVTGASTGIGRATAILMTKQGAKIALVARSQDELTKLSSQLVGSFPIAADMTKPADIKKMIQAVFKHYGRIDVLVNNAGQGYDAPIEIANLDSFQHIFELDLVGPLVAMQQVIPIMKAQGEGSIINISSGTALMHLPSMGIYAAIKAALAHLSLTARAELDQYNINVGVVYPYITLTDFEKNTVKDTLDNKADSPPDNSYQPPPPDRAELVATKIIDCIKNETAEVFAHDWMGQSGNKD